MRAAVEREFKIIGETLTPLAKLDAVSLRACQITGAHHRISQHSHPWLRRRG